jgi:sugar phosphate isomerase/epimerase
MKNPLCLSTLGCPQASLAEAAALAREHGIDALELRCLSGQIIEPNNFASTLPDPAAARTTAETQGRRIRVLSTSLKLFAPPPDAIDTLLAFARVADVLGASWLRVFDGGRTNEPPSEAEWSAATRLMSDWQALRTRAGFACDLAIETHWALCSPAVATSFIERFPQANILWDTHHTWKAGIPLADYWAAAGSRIGHLHVKDSHPDPAAKAGWRYVLPGQGEFPWADLRALIGTSEFRGAVSLEWEKKWHPDLPELPEALKAFRHVWPDTNR